MKAINNFKPMYKNYVALMKQQSQKFTETLGSKVEILPTSLKVIKQCGINNEAANCINTAEYFTNVFFLLKRKGYEIPDVYVSEEQLPRKHNLSGLQFGSWVAFGPGRLEVTDPNLATHELGHYLQSKKQLLPEPLASLYNFARSIFRPFLNKSEKEILIQDYKRAYEEGYFKHIELGKCVKKGYIKRKDVREFRKNPAVLLVKDSFSSINEFVADYFTIAARGFKFSPEIEARYKCYQGPEIKELITDQEIKAMVQMRKKLEKRTTMNVVI